MLIPRLCIASDSCAPSKHGTLSTAMSWASCFTTWPTNRENAERTASLWVAASNNPKPENASELSGAPQAATNSGRSCSYLPRYT